MLMGRVLALREAPLDRKMTRMHETGPVSGLTFPFEKSLFLIFPEKRWLGNAPEKLDGQDRHHPIHQIDHQIPFPPDKDHADSEFVLEPVKEPVPLRPGLVPERPIEFHRDLRSSPGILVDNGNQPEPPSNLPGSEEGNE